MSDYSHITEQIGSYLAGTDPRWNDELTELASQYAALCLETNDRMRRCADFLRRGMRSEAVHLATCPPSLTELMATLRLPEREQWNQACVAEGVAPPPRLLTSGLEDLKAAVDRERQLERLLARHRVLALATAPAASRLDIVRALAKRDAGNPCWTEGIRELESVRFAEMRDEAKSAFRAKDLAVLELIAAEIADGPWLTELPDDLRLGADAALKKLRLEAALHACRDLLVRIYTSYEAKSYDECSELFSQWQELVSSRQLELPAKLQAQVRPVAAWLAAEERRREIAQRMAVVRPILDAQVAAANGSAWQRLKNMIKSRRS